MQYASGLFDPEFYRKLYTDSPGSELAAYIHYRLVGSRALRQPSEFFDPTWYLESYPDVRSAGISPVKHYLSSGSQEGRDPGPNFSTQSYLKLNPDVARAGMNPLVHYLAYGRTEGRAITEDDDARTTSLVSQVGPLTTRIDPRAVRHPKRYVTEGVTNATRPHPSADNSILIPLAGTGQKDGQRIAVMLHAYYPEIAVHIIENYLPNIKSAFSLYITATTNEALSQISAARIPTTCTQVVARLVENRGRDIAPKFVALKDVYHKYDLVLHLHTKKSPHHTRFTGWLDYLLHELLGSPAIVDAHLTLLQATNVGITFPAHHDSVYSLLNWGYDFSIASSLLARAGHKLDIRNTLEFPSGSMFWARSAALKPLLDLDLQYDDFPSENGQIDGTLAHAIERTLLFFGELAGFRWAKTSTNRSGACGRPAPIETTVDTLETALLSTYRPVTCLAPGHYDPICVIAPEVARFNVIHDFSKRRRLNLLVPSVAAKDIYGGISTAIEFGRTLLKELGPDTDYRLIVTDSADIDVYSKDNNLFAAHMSYQGKETRTIVNGSKRSSSFLPVRKNDIFIATAWWTAYCCNLIRSDQARLFAVPAEKTHLLVYLVQDDERIFYPNSTKTCLIDSTYRSNSSTLFVVNSIHLAKHFSTLGDIHASYYLPYSLNGVIKSNIRTQPREKTILFYGRRSVDRNCFDIIVAGIDLWQRRYPTHAHDWNIISIGEPFGSEFLQPLQNSRVAGKLSLHEYTDLMNRSSLGISLMLSPHPSYPPLEMAAAGMFVISNDFSCKDLSSYDGILSLGVVSPETLCDAISLGVSSFDERKTKRRSRSKTDQVKPYDGQIRPYSAPALAKALLNSLVHEPGDSKV